VVKLIALTARQICSLFNAVASYLTNSYTKRVPMGLLLNSQEVVKYKVNQNKLINSFVFKGILSAKGA